MWDFIATSLRETYVLARLPQLCPLQLYCLRLGLVLGHVPVVLVL